jgi:tellurite resistance protein TehA-like permease
VRIQPQRSHRAQKGNEMIDHRSVLNQAANESGAFPIIALVVSSWFCFLGRVLSMSPVITPEVEETIRNAINLMKTQEPYQIACFVYALGFANGCMEMSAKELARITITKAQLAEIK